MSSVTPVVQDSSHETPEGESDAPSPAAPDSCSVNLQDQPNALLEEKKPAAVVGTTGSLDSSMGSRPRPKHLLEMLTARELTVLNLFQALALVICVVCLCLLPLGVETSEVTYLIGMDGQTESFLLYDFSAVLLKHIIVGSVCCGMLLLALVLFSVHHRRSTAVRSDEVVWMYLLMACAMLFVFPFSSIPAYINYPVCSDCETFEERIRFFFQSGSQVFKPKGMASIITSLTFVLSTNFFWWATACTFGTLKRTPHLEFYKWKAIFLITLVAIRILLSLSVDCNLSYYPVASFAILVHLAIKSIDHTIPTATYIFCAFYFAMELALLGWLFFTLRKTRKFLSKLNYLKHCSKIKAFHLFYMNLVFFLFCSNIILIAETMINWQETALLLNVSGYLSLIGIVDASFFKFYFTWYVLVLGYVYLPADTAGFFNFRHRELQDKDLRFIYQVPEFREEGRLVIRPNELSISTTIKLLNFAWAVYWHGANGLEDAQMLELNTSSIQVKQYIAAEDTDTHCYFCTGVDRIVVAFKGTKSVTNIHTDLDFASVPIPNVLHSLDPGVNFVVDGMGRILGDHVKGVLGELFESSRVHRGFGAAYSSVAKQVLSLIIEEYERDPRPIFFTGHSLGGALATLCALDFAMKYPALQSAICVTTFGSPRVGNSAFRDLYEMHVKTTWRVANAGDVVTQIPKRPFRHVGRLVLCLPTGELLVDPDFIEKRMFHSTEMKPVFHKLACYHQVLKSYLMIYHSKAVEIAGFWNWEIPVEVERLYGVALRKAAKIQSEC